MPNLRTWIEAQLKKGYSVSQIKAVLYSRGYPSKAVAEVDRIANSSSASRQNHSKKHIPNKLVLAGLLIATVFVAWILAMSFLSKQPVGNIIPEQKPDGRLNQDGAEPLAGGLIKSKEPEAGKIKEMAKEFNNDFCSSLMPENIRGMPLNEYSLAYHIDGSPGENVKWVAPEQPPAEFSLFESPKAFFVSSGNGFEGCEYMEKLENKDKNRVFKNQVKSSLILCNGTELFANKKNWGNYDEISLYYFKSEEEIIHAIIFASFPFNEEASILSSLGCKQ